MRNIKIIILIGIRSCVTAIMMEIADIQIDGGVGITHEEIVVATELEKEVVEIEIATEIEIETGTDGGVIDLVTRMIEMKECVLGHMDAGNDLFARLCYRKTTHWYLQEKVVKLLFLPPMIGQRTALHYSPDLNLSSVLSLVRRLRDCVCN